LTSLVAGRFDTYLPDNDSKMTASYSDFWPDTEDFCEDLISYCNLQAFQTVHAVHANKHYTYGPSQMPRFCNCAILATLARVQAAEAALGFMS
jgi:hypothetical protein